MPRVSVIIPVFNAAKTVGQAIDSVLAQTMRDFEIVAVDDHGNTKKIKRSVKVASPMSDQSAK